MSTPLFLVCEWNGSEMLDGINTSERENIKLKRHFDRVATCQ